MLDVYPPTLGRYALWAAVAFLCILPACRKQTGEVPTPPDPSQDQKQSEEQPSAEVKEDKKVDDPVFTENRADDSSDGVLIQLKHHPGKALIYDSMFNRNQLGEDKYVETGKFYLTFYTVGQTPEGLSLVSIRRTFLERNRKDTYANNKTLEPVLPNTDTAINLGPNFDMRGGQLCYAFDLQNRVAYRNEHLLVMNDDRFLRGIVIQEDKDSVVLETSNGREVLPRARIKNIEKVPTPHVLKYDSPHYFFPIFSTKKVKIGQSWRYRVPVIIPLEQGSERAVLPTQFEMSVSGRLREIRASEGQRLAIVDYQLSGQFDSSKDPYQSRFSQEFKDRNSISHGFEGTGWVLLNLDQGIIIQKSEDIKVSLYASSLVRQDNNKPPEKKESNATITSHFEMKRLPPGTRLQNGTLVPEDR